MTIQLAGNVNSAPMEVELNTLAARFVLRPQDFGLIGSYAAGGTFLLISTGTSQIGANSTFSAMKHSGAPGTIIVIRKINVGMTLSQGASGTGMNVLFLLRLFRVNNFISQFVCGTGAGGATGNTPVQLGLSNATRLRSTMPYASADFILPSDGTGTASILVNPGVQSTVEVQPIAIEGTPLVSLAGFGVNASTLILIPFQPIFHARVAEYPLVIEPGNGWIIAGPNALVQAVTTGTTINVSVGAVWDELELRAY